MSANLENSAVAIELKKISFHSNPEEGNTKECSNHHKIVLISHARKIMPQILQDMIQQFVNQELADIQAGFRKERNQRAIANILWIIKKVREFQKNIYFCFINYAKAFDCVDHNTVENSERDGHTILLRN